MAVETKTPPGAASKRPAKRPARGLRSSVVLKIIMAVSGIALIGFVYAHMIGNLKVFAGLPDFDHYAHWLRELGAPVFPEKWALWIMRIGLLVAVAAHIVAATVLARRARKARPVRYAHRTKVQGSYSARTMRWGGVIVLLFVIFHILDLTTGTLNPAGHTENPSERVIAGFAPERWYVTLFYVLAVVAVGLHLRHGIFSAVRTLGQRSARGERIAKQVALAMAVVLVVGYLSVPFAVLTGLVS